MDTWLIDGWLQVDHELNCECALDDMADMMRAYRFMPSMHLRRHVQAPDAEQAEAAAVQAWRDVHSDRVDSQCDVYFERPPYAFNTSQHEREKALLRAWNEDKPIIVQDDPPALFATQGES